MTLALGLVLIVLLLIDWRQTLTISDHPEKWSEMNPVLGPHPSRGRVHSHFALGILVASSAMLFAYNYPVYGMYVAIGLGLGIALELVCTVNNYRIGIK